MNAPTTPASHPEFIFPTELSARIGIAVQTLARWRCEGRGPKFVKIGGKKIGYRVSHIEEWLALRSYESTGSAANDNTVSIGR